MNSLADPVSLLRQRPALGVSFGLLLILVGMLVFLLWPQWTGDPDLSHGLFALPAFLVLLYEARRSGRVRFLTPGPIQGLSVALTLFLGLGALVAGGLFAAALEWDHALVGFTLATAVCLLLGSGLLVASRSDVRLIPLNWPAVLAAGILLLSAPIPPGTYTRLTLELQFWVTNGVLHTLHLLGVAAVRHGNIIELAQTSVGVEEACSGIRSLLSCVFAGVFFSGILVRRTAARALVIGLAPVLALSMNFVRSLLLTLLANAGIDIAGAWHDATGYVILGATSVMLAGLGLWLGRCGSTSEIPDQPPDIPTGSQPSGRFQAPLVAGALGLAVLLMGFLGIQSRQRSPLLIEEVPSLAALVPANAPGWSVVTSDDLYRFSATLQTDHLIQRTYFRGSDDDLTQITVYLAYWSAGQASVSRVATHTPDACWPGSGWEPIPLAQTRERIATLNHEAADAEYREFQNQGISQHVWFWHLYGGAPVEYINPLSPRNLIEIALRYGFSRTGDQMFVRISSNRPWEDISAEPLLDDLIRQLNPLGL